LENIYICIYICIYIYIYIERERERERDKPGSFISQSNGSATLSRVKMPYAEAKSCQDKACMFCPCGALRLRLDGSGEAPVLAVNELEVRVKGYPSAATATLSLRSTNASG